MPSYLTLEEYGNLSLLPAAYGNVSNTVKEAVIAARSAMADAYLANHFTLPLTDYDDDGFKTAIAAGVDWDLMRRRGFNPETGADIAIRQHYEDMWIGNDSYFGLVRAGKITPQVTDSSAGAAAGVSTGSPRVYTDEERGWTDRVSDRTDMPGGFVDDTD